MDPNMFPIVHSTGKLYIEYDTFWNNKNILKKIESGLGFCLRVRPSGIDHHEAGEGVFLSCKEQEVVLPGTFLGFFPGLIVNGESKGPKEEKNSIHSFLKRSDDYWLDYNCNLPYPVQPGVTLEERIEQY